MTDTKVPYSALVDGFTTDSLEPGAEAVSIFSLVKFRDSDGKLCWSGRSGGEVLTSEELLGALEGLVTSLRNDIAADWE